MDGRQNATVLNVVDGHNNAVCTLFTSTISLQSRASSAHPIENENPTRPPFQRVLVPPVLPPAAVRLLAHAELSCRPSSAQHYAALQPLAVRRKRQPHLARRIVVGAEIVVDRLQQQLRKHPVGVRQPGAHHNASVAEAEAAHGADLAAAERRREQREWVGGHVAFVGGLETGAAAELGWQAFVDGVFGVGIRWALTSDRTARR